VLIDEVVCGCYRQRMARCVFVHGAFGGAWEWELVTPALEAAGHSAETLDLPGGGDDQTPVEEVTLDSCVARVCDVLRQRPEPAVLVGYSMGGVIATQAASLCPERVAALVFVAAFMPGDGQSLVDLTQLPEGQDDQVQANIVVEGDPPVATLPQPAVLNAVFNACPPDEAAPFAARMRPQPVAPFATPVRLDDSVLASIPRSYVFTAQDQSIPPALQRRMIQEHPCRKVFELDADHFPFLSAKDGLVAALVELAADADGRSSAP
jgi:pimeloyl-ACP methyl ester carboxylesterase